MPIKMIKGSLEYCMGNKLFFLLLLLLFLILEISTDIYAKLIITPFILLFIISGYGLQVIHDVINGGVRLPRILPKKMISYGIKGFIVFFFYIFIQMFVMMLITNYLHFPEFDLEDIFLEFGRTVHLFYSHDILSFVIFIVSGFLIVYLTTFFMELALAKLADGGSLKDAFNFRLIKHAIDIIGWGNYIRDYSAILFSIIVLSFFNLMLSPYAHINVIAGTITDFLIFIIEYRGMGLIYDEYLRKKAKTENSL
ncbi:DUF4013 domain-containing protein [Methanobrevibacter sp.]